MGRLQQRLFPKLEECWESRLTEKEQKLVTILELVKVEKYIPKTSLTQWMGRKILKREAIARAFVAKACYDHDTTRALMEQLETTPTVRLICGFEQPSDIPSEATFSRAFAEFAQIGLGEKVHEALVANHVKPELVGHISRDSTAIDGREKPAKKPKKAKPVSRKRGRPAKGEIVAPKEEKRLEKQRGQSPEEALKELPMNCDVGMKKNSKGNTETWIGYKLHADINDCGLPLNVVLTAASVHDSQVAIPMIKETSARVDYLYDLMDAAYDAGPIYDISKSLGHVPIIDKNSRGKTIIPMAPHEAVRYNERSSAERFNSRIKEEFGGKKVMVRGGAKVKLHLMFGVLALFADQLIKRAS